MGDWCDHQPRARIKRRTAWQRDLGLRRARRSRVTDDIMFHRNSLGTRPRKREREREREREKRGEEAELRRRVLRAFNFRLESLAYANLALISRYTTRNCFIYVGVRAIAHWEKKKPTRPLVSSSTFEASQTQLSSIHALARKVGCTDKHFFTLPSLLHSYCFLRARGSRDRSALVYTGPWKEI